MRKKIKATLGAIGRFTGVGNMLLRWRGVTDGTLVLSFHRVVRQPYFRRQMAVSVHNFSALLDYVCKHAEVVDLTRLLELDRQPARRRLRVALTFDDGYRDNYENAFPELAKRKLPATVFLTSGVADNAVHYLWWDAIAHVLGHIDQLLPQQIDAVFDVFQRAGVFIDRDRATEVGTINHVVDSLRTLPQVKRNSIVQEAVAAGGDIASKRKRIMMSWDEVREMMRGGIAFGAHTVTHPNLNEISVEELSHELAHCKQRIEQETGEVVSTFAYPSGKFTDSVVAAVRRAGLKIACTTEPGVYRADGDILRVPRIDVTDDAVTGKHSRFSPNMWHFQLLRQAR